MHQDELGVPDGGQCPAHRLGTLGTALDHHGSLTEQKFRLVHAVGRHGDDHPIDHSGSQHTVDGALQHRATTEFDERLRKSGAQPFTRSRPP